jgi:energy-coupling factor transport system ATP-binding protein
MIHFEKVSYAYPADKSNPVIQDISLTIKEGEELAIMGGNGCGKTTLGLLLCGVLKPDSGAITFDAEYNEKLMSKSAIGFLFQDPDNGLVATTVEREVAFSLENRNVPTAEMRRIVDDVIDRFDMEPFRNRLVWNLSGGEKQRLSLAGLFAAGASVLFMDEPASYLDYQGSVQMDDALTQVRKINPGLTIIRVTQYPKVAEKYPRVIVMSDGEIIKDDKPKQIFSDRQLMERSGILPPLSFLTPKTGIENEPVDSAPVTANAHAMLKLDDISFTYECATGFSIFDGLSLTVNQGEVLGLVGPSGSGKSSLAQLICGIFSPTSGSLNFADDSCRAAMSFQQPERQFFLDTCYDEILYGIKGKYKSNALGQETIRKCMRIVGLEFDVFKDRDPHTLSGGEARRLAFAIVVALDPDLYIFDEPTCGLDETGIQFFRKMLARLKDAGKTVIIISHNSEIIADLSDRVALLMGGKIAAVEHPLQFFTSDVYKGTLAVPDVIDYQETNYGNVYTVHPNDIFEVDQFFA